MQKKLLALVLASCVSLGAFAQSETAIPEEPVKTESEVMKENIENNASEIKKLKKLKISGYVQAQYELAQQFGSTKVGGTTAYQTDKDPESGNFSRFGIRRGRVKVAWEESFGSAVFQLDITEKGVGIKDAYLKANDPWLKMFSLTGGIFDRPFGDEISYSSSKRESPERSLIFQKLFPDERDLGAMLTIAAPKNSKAEGLKLDAGLFSGNGIRLDDNSKMDFIGHLKYDKKWSDFAFGVGASVYLGATNNASPDSSYYVVENSKWAMKKDDKLNKLHHRQYFGIDAQFTAFTSWGITNIRGEYLLGTQPSKSGDFGSPKADTYTGTAPFNYMRNFMGGHIYLIQDIYRTPLTFVCKYGYLDPNTKIKGNDITNKTDLANHNFGLGLLVKMTSYLRLQLFYEIVINEKTDKIAAVEQSNGKMLDYNKNIKDNVFTARLQFKF